MFRIVLIAACVAVVLAFAWTWIASNTRVEHVANDGAPARAPAITSTATEPARLEPDAGVQARVRAPSVDGELEDVAPALLIIVSGRIVDAAHEPVAKAGVELDSIDWIGTAASSFKLAESGVDGRFRIERVQRRPGLVLHGFHPRAGAGVRELALDDSPAIDVGDLVLEGLRRVEGVVQVGYLGEKQRDVLADVAVVLVPVHTKTGFEHICPDRLSTRTCTSRADGSFVFEDVLPACYLAEVDLEGSTDVGIADVNVSHASAKTDVRLVVLRTTSVRGVVVDTSGAPVRGASVSAGAKPVRTDADGRFVIDGLGRKPVRVDVTLLSMSGTQRLSLEDVVPGGSELRIEMPKLEEISGTVLSPDGEPEPFASVSAMDANVHEAASAFADEQGGFTFSLPVGSTYELVARPTKRVSVTSRAADPESDLRGRRAGVRAGTKDVVLRLQHGG